MESVEKKLVNYPSYLKELLENDKQIYLCTAYTSKKVEPIFNGNESYEARDYLNYVGSPLEIDLKEGEISITQNNPDVWKSEENNQHPMSYCTALKVINQYNNNLLKEFEKHPIYCICDAKDKHKTIMLGSFYGDHKIVRSRLYFKGMYSFDEVIDCISYMDADHKEALVGSNCTVKLKTKFVYDLYPEKSHSKSSLLLEAETQEITNSLNKIYPASLTAKIQIGNIKSSCHQYWSDLQILKKLLRKAENLNDNEILTSENELDLNNSVAELETLISKEIDKGHFKGNNGAFASQLWNIAKAIKFVHTLRYFFERLFMCISLHNITKHTHDENETILFTFIAKISKQELKVAQVSKLMALYLLIECGLEHLKYNMSSKMSEHMQESCQLENWCTANRNFNKLTELCEQQETSKDLLNYFNELDNNANLISNLYIALETCELIKPAFLGEETFSDVSKKTFEIFKENKLSADQSHTFKTMIPYNFKNLRQEPIVWSVQKITTSEEQNSKKTVVYFSKTPIIPPTIFSDCVSSPTSNTSEELYYVLELKEITNIAHTLC